MKARDIEYRALGTSGMKDGFWCYGYYVRKALGVEGVIMDNNIPCAINESTLGRYTGIHDKNGRKIYEGDILKITLRRNQSEEKFYEIGEVYWNEVMCRFQISGQNYTPPNGNWEVTGNIYQNKNYLDYPLFQSNDTAIAGGLSVGSCYKKSEKSHSIYIVYNTEV